MTAASLCESSLDGLVDIRTEDRIQRDCLVASIHDRQILDVLKPFNGDTYFHPSTSAIGKVVPTIWAFVDGVGCFWVKDFDKLPSPRPGEIRKIPFLLHMLIAVDCIELRENGLVFFHGVKRLKMKHIDTQKTAPTTGTVLLS